MFPLAMVLEICVEFVVMFASRIFANVYLNDTSSDQNRADYSIHTRQNPVQVLTVPGEVGVESVPCVAIDLDFA